MKLVIILCVIYAFIAAGMFTYQRKFMYFPDKQLLAPAQYGLNGVKADKITTTDGELLDYWYIAAKENRPVILYFHGNGGHLGYRAGFFQAAQAKGYGLFMLSYRGYGTSTGSPSEQGFYRDAKAAYEQLRQWGITDKQIILYGESIGTGSAIELARNKQLQLLVLQAPFTSAAERASEIYWWLPVKALLKDRFDNMSKLTEIQTPTLILAAEQDYIVPAEHAKQLFSLLKEPKQLVIFEGIGHNDFGPDQILTELEKFRVLLRKTDNH